MIRKILLLISGLAFLTYAYADDPCQSISGPYGPMACTAGTTSTVFANGPVTMNNTIVSGATKINGTLSAVNVQFGKKKRNILNTDNLLLNHKNDDLSDSLTVNGKVQLEDAVVYGNTTINGYLVANKTTFMGTLTIASNNLQLNDCNTGAIIIKDSNGDGVVSPQTITLSEHTQVNGNITFKQAGGIVYLGANASITGRVIGGEIVAEKKPATAIPKSSDTSNNNPSSSTTNNQQIASTVVKQTK